MPSVPARHSSALPDGRVSCRLCPRGCRLAQGQRGACWVRRAGPAGLELTTWGESSGLACDPIEKKPLHHFLPGSLTLSLGQVGCNLACAFCQNWRISSRAGLLEQALEGGAEPEFLALQAAAYGCRSVSFTYNDPVPMLEFVEDAARTCRAAGLKTVGVTAGYVSAQARPEFFACFDAVNVDLKAFDQGFYGRWCGAELKPVLETLAWARTHSPAWLEITTLLIPGLNDGERELGALADWVRRELGPETPLHFSGFHPSHRLAHLEPTPLATLRRARERALDAGLLHVYTGNRVDPQGQATPCPGCRRTLIEREGFRIKSMDLALGASCPGCGRALAGIFDEPLMGEEPS